MRKVNYIFLLVAVILLIAFLASPVTANRFYHEITIHLEGEWELQTNIAIPDVTSGLVLKGVGIGSAHIHSILSVHDSTDLINWWKLF